jgi:hypothetical protein
MSRPVHAMGSLMWWQKRCQVLLRCDIAQRQFHLSPRGVSRLPGEVFGSVHALFQTTIGEAQVARWSSLLPGPSMVVAGILLKNRHYPGYSCRYPFRTSRGAAASRHRRRLAADCRLCCPIPRFAPARRGVTPSCSSRVRRSSQSPVSVSCSQIDWASVPAGWAPGRAEGVCCAGGSTGVLWPGGPWRHLDDAVVGKPEADRSQPESRDDVFLRTAVRGAVQPSVTGGYSRQFGSRRGHAQQHGALLISVRARRRPSLKQPRQ